MSSFYGVVRCLLASVALFAYLFSHLAHPIACILAFFFQQTSLADVIQSLYKGYDTSMAVWMTEFPTELSTLFNRGGLYELSEPVIISIIVFVYVGAIDKINAMPIIVDRVFGFAKSRSSTILATLASTSFINAFTAEPLLDVL